jgi:hypothetical protein
VSILSRFRRRKAPYAALSDEERIARYVYLLGTLPASVIESAHAAAFKDLPAERRREMFEQLRPFMSDAERNATSDDPKVLAKLVRRAEVADPRAFLRDSGVMALVALNFVHSQAVSSYFLFGAGSLVLSDEPAWIGEMVDPGMTGVDAAGYGGFDGSGGWDAGGFGGFDGGVGGFDGGGGGFG